MLQPRYAEKLGSRHYYEGKPINANPFPSMGLHALATAYKRGYMDSSERHAQRIEARKAKENE